jgi:hypothetical protein
MWRRKLRIERLEERRPLAADFSGNGTVGPEDLEIWKTGFGTVNTATPSTGDSNGDMDVDGADFLTWQRELGQSTVPLVAPREVEARALGPTSGEVTWQASVGATSYAVQRRRPDTETEFTTIAPNVTATSYTDIGLASDTLYEYRVIAQQNPQSVPSHPAQFTTNQSNLTAYRPQGVQSFDNSTGEAIYDPFPKTPVIDEHEASSTLGPGIRINADDDNQNGVLDRGELGTAVPQENDLVEVKIDRLPGAGNLVLSPGSSLFLWSNYDRTGSLLSGDPITFVNNSATVFVEWAPSTHGTALLTLIDQATQTPLDTVRFHSFRSMVVVFGGNGQNPQDTDGDGNIGDPVEGGPNREGMFDTASELYVTGWDVYAYNEEVDLVIPYAEVINAVDRRNVRPDLQNFQGGGIGIMGYSQGGGATNDLIELLTTNDPEGDFLVMFAGYLDAVDRDPIPPNDPLPETDWPDDTF